MHESTSEQSEKPKQCNRKAAHTHTHSQMSVCGMAHIDPDMLHRTTSNTFFELATFILVRTLDRF